MSELDCGAGVPPAAATAPPAAAAEVDSAAGPRAVTRFRSSSSRR